MRRPTPGAAASGLLLLLISTPALAHFRLIQPENMYEQDSYGGPQKNPPCGDTDTPGGFPGTPTGVLTTFTEGETVTLKLEEAIFHPGHYRVAVAANAASLPDDPPVTPGLTPCGTTVIEDDPQLPLLADGILAHTEPFAGVQTAQIKLPQGFTCDRCVLQVEEFMADHGLNRPGGCFYHHCAAISVVPAGSGGGGAGGKGAAPASAGDGGGCSAARSSGDGALAGLALATLALRRRRSGGAR